MKLQHAAEEQRRAARNEQRYTDICATMPDAAPLWLKQLWRQYVRVAVSQYGKRGLARVHWPWNDREHTVRTPRGKGRQLCPSS